MKSKLLDNEVIRLIWPVLILFLNVVYVVYAVFKKYCKLIIMVLINFSNRVPLRCDIT